MLLHSMMKTKLVASTIKIFVQLGLSSDRTFFGGLINGLLSGLPRSLVALTFNGVTDKKVQFNTDILKFSKTQFFIQKKMVLIKS